MEYTAGKIKEVLNELGIVPYKTNKVDGHQAATILTWRLKADYNVEREYTTIAVRRRVDTGALPVAEKINARLNLYDVRDIFELPLVPGRAEGTRKRLSKQNTIIS